MGLCVVGGCYDSSYPGCCAADVGKEEERTTTDAFDETGAEECECELHAVQAHVNVELGDFVCYTSISEDGGEEVRDWSCGLDIS